MSALNMYDECQTDCKCYQCKIRRDCHGCIDCSGERFSQSKDKENTGYIGIDEPCKKFMEGRECK